jgi:hypothetical protein
LTSDLQSILGSDHETHFLAAEQWQIEVESIILGA